jgi:hypothetical protein
MSREERRAYQRMTKKQDPYALPATGAARARMERQQRLKARRAATAASAPGGLTRRFLWWTFGGAAGIGLIAFSLAWPNMPLAAYVGLGVGAAWLAAGFGLRAMARRATARGAAPRR